jgi:hypothetical protein
MLEFYLDDHLIECYTMGCPDGEQVRVGVCGPRSDRVLDLCVWRMSLSAS